jgi:hypothetical protein
VEVRRGLVELHQVFALDPLKSLRWTLARVRNAALWALRHCVQWQFATPMSGPDLEFHAATLAASAQRHHPARSIDPRRMVARRDEGEEACRQMSERRAVACGYLPLAASLHRAACSSSSLRT